MKRHLSTLSILHYVYGGSICVGGFAAFALIFLGLFLSSDWLLEHGDGDPVPGWLGALFQTFGWVVFLVVEVWGLLTILSGTWITNRKHRTGTQIVAGLNCLNIPFGIALSIFTFVVLNDEEVRSEYSGFPQAVVF